MSEHPSDTSENRLRASIAGALAFVSFGLLSLAVLGISGVKTDVEKLLEGEFSMKEKSVYSDNLKEIEAVQAGLYNEDKVSAAIASFKAPGESKPSSLAVPGSPTDVKNQEAASAPKQEEPVTEDSKEGDTPKKAEKPGDDVVEGAPAKKAPKKSRPSKPEGNGKDKGNGKGAKKPTPKG